MSTMPQDIDQTQEPEVEDVSYEAAKADLDQEPADVQQEEVKKQEDILDQIVPKKEPKTWTIGPQEMERTFVQKEMSFIAKMQWFSLIGDALDKAFSGPQGVSVNALFSAPSMRGGELNASSLRDADSFIKAVAKLLGAAPDFLFDSYMIWLSVPDYERDIVKDIMKLPADEGGLTDDQGFGIIETFLDQNYEALASFFSDRLSRLAERAAKLGELRQSSRPSKR